MSNNLYPVAKFQGNTNTLQNHLDTLLDVASAQDKNLQAINKAYSGLIKLLIKAAQGKSEEDITKTQLDCIKILLSEHKHLNKVVADIEELIKKVRVYQEQEKVAPQDSNSKPSTSKKSVPDKPCFVPLDTPMPSLGGK